MFSGTVRVQDSQPGRPLASLWIIIALLLVTNAACTAADELSFSQHVLPILSDRCFPCHGPDSSARKGELRLDNRADAIATRSSGAAIVPGNVDQSLLILRIMSEDLEQRMPPPDSKLSLSPKEKQQLQRWVESGAQYQSHWSFVRPIRPQLPVRTHESSSDHPIDRFLDARRQLVGMSRSQEADRATLLRRLTLDLTGLPPTLDELDTFLADQSSDAYERQVDRLLGSARYGERMAVEWLDSARYADTHGYLFDTERSMWRWRDTLIASFNSNQPFDEFTIEQLAGDLLPSPTQSQMIASGFNRNHIINNEAGATPEEYFVENIVDRINTTATVWMGLSFACAQCHDHKYDPISQREYYQFYAFFNNVPEVGLDGLNSNAQPILVAPTVEQESRLTVLTKALQQAEADFAPLEKQLGPQQAAWEESNRSPSISLSCGLQLSFPFDGDLRSQVPSSTEPFAQDGTPQFSEGFSHQGVLFDGKWYVEAGPVADFDRESTFTLMCWVYPNQVEGRRGILSRMAPAEAGFRGWTLQIIGGKVALILVNQFPENLLQVETKHALEVNQWKHLAVTYDGSGEPAGVKIYVDGKLQEIGLSVSTLTKSFQVDQPLWIGKGHPEARFAGRLDDLRIYDHVLSADAVAQLPGLSLATLLNVPMAERSSEQSRRIRTTFLDVGAPTEWRDAFKKIGLIREEHKKYEKALPTVMVMKEQEKQRETRMLVRGAYNRPGEVVTVGTPAFLPQLPSDAPRNRLGLARWLVDPSHPLTSRVIVNRIWQMHFGTGLVRTSDNFGLQGEPPSHPELLDWLAVELVDSGWNLKRIHHLIVTSAAYRQSSHASADSRSRDPENRWISRAPRPRLPAEFVRDAALASSGLLIEQLGGRSVKPYMLPELWREVAFDTSGKVLTAQVYEQDRGEALYRRSLYTFWKRTAPPPTMLLFDAPDRERCVVRRETTNTPLQALVLMNDPTYVEASRRLAQRMVEEGGTTSIAKLTWGFRIATGRYPTTEETELLFLLLTQQLTRFQAEPQAARDLLEVGDLRRASTAADTELAAYTVVANAFYNLDETITRR